MPGVFALFLALFTFSQAEKILSLAQELYAQHGRVAELTAADLRRGALLQALIGPFYIITSLGLVRRQEWARKGVLYFAFFTAVLVLIGTLQNPAAVTLAVTNIIHPGAMILYFTSKKSGDWFTKAEEVKRPD